MARSTLAHGVACLLLAGAFAGCSAAPRTPALQQPAPPAAASTLQQQQQQQQRVHGIPPTVGPIPEELAVFRQWFDKHASVFGVNILATSDTAAEDVQHAANVMAQYLDNDENGEPDNLRVVLAMLEARATLVMWPTDDEERMDEFFDNAPTQFRYQDLQGDECWPARPMEPDVYDGAVEEVLHLVTGYGWSGVWPELFGECFEGEDPGGSASCSGSLLAQQMDRQIADCGFAYACRLLAMPAMPCLRVPGCAGLVRAKQAEL
jgi:hypothetical protein